MYHLNRCDLHVALTSHVSALRSTFVSSRHMLPRPVSNQNQKRAMCCSSSCSCAVEAVRPKPRGQPGIHLCPLEAPFGPRPPHKIRISSTLTGRKDGVTVRLKARATIAALVAWQRTRAGDIDSALAHNASGAQHLQKSSPRRWRHVRHEHNRPTRRKRRQEPRHARPVVRSHRRLLIAASSASSPAPGRSHGGKVQGRRIQRSVAQLPTPAR